MKIITPHLVPCRHPQVDHWESVSEYNGLGQAPWVEYILSGGAREIHGWFFYVGPDGKSVREFKGPMLSGPYVVFLEITRSALFGRPLPGEPVPDSLEQVFPDDILVFNQQPMRVYFDPFGRKYGFADYDHFGTKLTMEGLGL